MMKVSKWGGNSKNVKVREVFVWLGLWREGMMFIMEDWEDEETEWVKGIEKMVETGGVLVRLGLGSEVIRFVVED